MKRLAKEPLVHFLVLGALLLGAHRLLGRPPAEGRRIVVDAAVADGLCRDFQRRAGRAPAEAERRALVDRYVDSELLYREALALGLDRGDVVVRRRLVQKMELVAGTAGEGAEPSERDLRAELAARPARYQRPERVALRHLFVARDRHPDAEREIERLRARMAQGADPVTLGDPFVRGPALPLSDTAVIDDIFGSGFAARVAALPDGVWSGPVASSFGLHLVRVEGREAARPARLEEVRDRVAEAVRERHREEALVAALSRLRSRYSVEVAPEALATARGAGSDALAAHLPGTTP